MDKYHLKAQGAIEFIMLSGFLLLVFIVIFSIFSGKITQINSEKVVLASEDVLIKVQKEIHLAVNVLDGYYRVFELPDKISNKNYDIFIKNNELIVTIGNQDFWRKISPVVGNITKGVNYINKTNGIIYLN